MSGIVATRTALKDALNTVTDITGYIYAPTVYRPGDAWAQFGGAAAPEDGRYRGTFTSTFRVIVVLPADAESADAFTDAHLDDLVDAVGPVLSVTTIDYAPLPANGSQAAYNALIIIGETE